MDGNELKKRIKEVLKENNYSISRLADGNGSLQKKLNNQINADTSLSAETIVFILESFPSVSAEWMLRGVGEMCERQKTHRENKRQDDVIAVKDEMIEELRRDKENLITLLQNMTKR